MLWVLTALFGCQSSVTTKVPLKTFPKNTNMVKSFAYDTNISFHKLFCLSFDDDNLHLLQDVMKSHQISCNHLQSPFLPWKCGTATKEPADMMSVILLITNCRLRLRYQWSHQPEGNWQRFLKINKWGERLSGSDRSVRKNHSTVLL